jgi:hypothetical protein
MLLSVIVPNYERLAYLRDGLVLLLQQSFPPEQYEIILVDNRANTDLYGHRFETSMGLLLGVQADYHFGLLELRVPGHQFLWK